MKIPGTTQEPPRAADRVPGSTRDAVMDLIHASGPQTAAVLAERLDLSPAAVRRHLDALVADGLLAERAPRPSLVRGRGRPARAYALTDAGRAAFPHAYDDLATTALRYLADTGGRRAVEDFAEHRARTLADALAGDNRPVTPEQLAAGLTGAGYAASVEHVGAEAGAGTQVCQHHCPVAHVAAEFPQLCEAETRAFERVLGTYVQRLATIAHGDGVCTTHVPTAVRNNTAPGGAAPGGATQHDPARHDPASHGGAPAGTPDTRTSNRTGRTS